MKPTYFYIQTEEHYHNNILNAPKDGKLTGRGDYFDNTLLLFTSRKEAEKYLGNLGIVLSYQDIKTNKNYYSGRGDYCLTRGEYDRTSYTIHSTQKISYKKYSDIQIIG